MQQIWIVGASSGIGESLALAYAQQGCRVYISARSEDSLNAMMATFNGLNHGKGMLVALPMDVTDDAAIKEALDEFQQDGVFLDKVIINAGTCEYIDDVQVDLALLNRVMDTNLYGAVRVANGVMPLLNPKGAQLAFVSSSVTYQALPRAHAYGASKAALRYYAECLKIDAQKNNVDVRIVSPGFVKTPLTDINDFDMPFMISSEDAAQRIIKGLSSATFDIQFPKRFTYLLKLFACLPDNLKFKLLAKQSRYEGKGLVGQQS